MEELPTLKTWSYTRLDTYEKCPHRAYLQYVLKRPEPPTVDRTALDRGNLIHTEAEMFVTGQGPFTAHLRRYETQFADLKACYEAGLVECEQDWGFTADWTQTGWTAPDVWARVKLDALHCPDPSYGIAIDYKSGKKYGNEIKHGQQGMTYVIAAFMRYPALEACEYAFWYLDQPDAPMKKLFTRAQAMRVMPSLHERAIAATTATVFPPKPNKMTCRFCPYSPNRGGDSSCEWGVEV